MNIEYIGNGAIIETEQVAFTYEVSDTPRDFYKIKSEADKLDWNNQTHFIGDYLVFPYGMNNNLPDEIKKVVQNNYIAPGIIKKKTQLLWGLGPQLYQEKIENKKLIRDWCTDDAITDWLESWGYEEYLVKAITDFHHIEGVFTKYTLNKGSRIGNARISKLEHIYPDRARLAIQKNNQNKEATHIITSDWSFKNVQQLSEYKVYPKYDFRTPFEHKTAILYSNMYSFCTDYYTVPDLYGSLEWLNRSTAVPLIFKALSKNSINLKYHIVSPQAFWNNKKKDIESNCTIRGVMYRDSMLEEYKTKFLKKIAEVLSGEENSGKYLHTTKSFTVEGTNLIEHGWEVKVIDQNIKDFVEAQIKISQRADHALSAGIGLHSALGNVSESGKSDSGSEQIYALKNYLMTGIDIPEMIVMKAINYALKANFPSKKLKLGFFHDTAEKEQDVNPKDRLLNQV